MSISEVIAKYLLFLLDQLQHDISAISHWWVWVFVLPLVVYMTFFIVKWWMLLVPMTLPLTLWLARRPPQKGVVFKPN